MVLLSCQFAATEHLSVQWVLMAPHPMGFPTRMSFPGLSPWPSNPLFLGRKKRGTVEKNKDFCLCRFLKEENAQKKKQGRSQNEQKIKKSKKASWRVPNPPGANPLVAERAFPRSDYCMGLHRGCQVLRRNEAGICRDFQQAPDSLSHETAKTSKRPFTSYQGVSTGGVRHSPPSNPCLFRYPCFFPFPIFLAFFCALFLSFLWILGVLQREKPLLSSGFPFLFFFLQGLEDQGPGYGLKEWPRLCKKVYWTKMVQNGHSSYYGQNDLIPNWILAWYEVHLGPPTVL